MTEEERLALAAVQFNWAVSPEDVWNPVLHHVPGLHATVANTVLDSVGVAAASTRSSPIGIVLRGEKGVGKTHLLRWVRQQVQDEGGYFFLVKFLDGEAFWRSAVHGLVDGFFAGQGDQLTPLLRRLAELTGMSNEVKARLCGTIPVSPADLESFVGGLRRLDRQVGVESQDTARALVLFAAADADVQEVGHGYLALDGDVADQDRAVWGFRRGARPPQLILRDLSRLLALTGPTVIAVDQIDTLIAQSSTGTAAVGGPARDDRAEASLLNRIADGLMMLREETRRTLSVVACIPKSWELIRTRTVDAAADRFRVLTLQGAIPDARIAQAIVGRHLGAIYAGVGFTPPHPTWPVRPSAFDGARDFTARRLLQRVDLHVRACLESGELRELADLEETQPPGPRSPAATQADLAALDARFAELREQADIDAALSPRSEDDRMPALLAAGLRCYIAELGEAGQDFTLDPPPGAKPALHARLRRVLDETTEDEVHWGFRAIASDHARAALTRIRTARTETGLQPGVDKRKLVLLRNTPWSRGPRTTEAVAEFEEAGGRSLPITADDLRTFVALEVLASRHDRGFAEWLAARRPAGRSELLRRVLAGAVRPSGRDGDGRDGSGGSDDRPRPAPPRHTPPPPPPVRPDPGTPVAPTGPTVRVGRAARDDRVLGLPLESLRKHTAIFAGSGSGKTVLLRRMIEECALLGVSAIVLDPNNDLARLGDPWPAAPAGWDEEDPARAGEYLAGTDVVVWTPRRERGRPLTFRPLPDFGAVADDVDDFTLAVDAAVAGLAPRALLGGRRAETGRAVLREAVTHFAREGGSELAGLVELLSDLPDGISRIRAAPRLAADMAEMLNAATVNDPLFGGAGEPLDPGVLLTPPAGRKARISVISFVGLPDDAQRQNFVNQLQMALFAWIKKNPAGDRPLGGLLVMDEAQTFASSGAMTACTGSTIALAAQARKYGLGLVFATQAPKGLHNRIPGNSATQFFGFLNAPAQITAANEIAKAKGGRVEDISRLRPGEFYAASEGLGFSRVRASMCLSHHPSSALTAEEVIARAQR